MVSPLLSLKGVSKHFHDAQKNLVILDRVSFEIYPSEVIALVGPSGTGKSTFLHICGLLDSDDSHHNTVFFQGISCGSLSEEKRAAIRARSMGFIYQYHHLLADLSAVENVMLPLLILGHGREEARKKALEMLDRMGLKNRHDHYPSQLSGGEQQRVSIARALVHQPALILADEPTGDLDHHTAEQVYQVLLEAVRDASAALVMVTHNLELAQRAQKVITLHKGMVVPYSQTS